MQDTNIIVASFDYTLKCACVYIYIYTYRENKPYQCKWADHLRFFPFLLLLFSLAKKQCGSFSEFKNGPHLTEILIQHIHAFQLYYSYEIILQQTIVQN